MAAVYIGSSLFNAQRVRQIKQRFQAAGVSVTYDWTVEGQLFNDSDLARCGQEEEDGVRHCDLFFMIHPARNGSHCELGMARVLDKHIVILEEIVPTEKKTFYYRPDGHPRPIHRFANEDTAINCALKLLQETK